MLPAPGPEEGVAKKLVDVAPAPTERANAVLATPPHPLSSPPLPDTATVGVVVPTHNDGDNIALLLELLLREPCVGDVVVVASGCDDETVPTVLEVAAAHPRRVRLYVEPERSGKAAAMNFGLGEVGLPYAVVVSGDVLPGEGSVARLVDALLEPGVGMAGGRPMPVNPPTTAVGHAAHLLWRMHHRLAVHRPKLGEMVALRSEAVVALPRTSVDEACFQALLEADGWRSVYVPEAVVFNRGPGTARDFVKQRRQIHTGHLWLRHRHDYTVPSLHPLLLISELGHDLRTEREWRQPRRIAWTFATVAMEMYARTLARADYLRGRENHVWEMVTSTKGPALVADGLGAGDR